MDDGTPNGHPDESKKPYTKPQIQEVPLRPDEAVLGGCKTSSISGAGQHRCTSPSNCSAPTS
jgi:hypothetical protein